MPRRMFLKLDRKAVGEFLVSLDPEVRVRAEALAESLRSEDPTMVVNVTPRTTDRASVRVEVESAGGLADQAKDGLITKAAARIGLEVRS